MKTAYKEVKPFITERLLITIDRALDFAIQNDFRIHGKINTSYKESVVEKISKVSFTMKKKINKMISRLENKMTRKNVNLFFHFLNKRLELNIPIKFEMSRAEAEVVSCRKKYKELKVQLEEERLKYKKLKASYYGSDKESTEYVGV